MSLRAPPRPRRTTAEGSTIMPDIDITEIPDAVATMFLRGDALAFDIRGGKGNQPIIERLRFLLDEGRIIGLWDSAEIMPGLSIGKTQTSYVLCDEGGFRGAFVTLEATLKHGMTMWEGYRHG